MKDQTINTDIIEEIKSNGSKYRASVPPYAWSRIESRLDNKNSKKEISFYKLFYNAALVAIIIGVGVLFSIVLNQTKTAPLTDNYAQNIHELNITNNTYPVYNIHQLQKAYMRLQDKQGDAWLMERNFKDL